MPGKVIGFGWTNVLIWLRWGSNTSLMPFALSHKGPGEQPHAKLWTFPPAMVQMIRRDRSKFSLTPRRIPVERKTPAAKREGDQDMVAKEESVSDAESEWSGVSDNSSTDSECTDVEASSLASDQDRFDTAYDAFRDLANDLYDIDLRRYPRGVTSEDAAGVPLMDGQEKPQELVHLPRTWPLARLTIPLEGLSKQIDRLLEGYCFQILATNRNPEAHNGRVLQTATHLTWILAEYLADTIAWLMRSILGHATKILFGTEVLDLAAVSGIPQQCTTHGGGP